ncbi:MAG TPA: SMP-30/gluconolactonase/LRE family protein [Magnetospirillaceae bacterium]|nr:SMP-30/gluconolactonase/LRE family protein [Magnetospirillaceae bacterium]
MTAPEVWMNGIILGESPRWHGGSIWFADWGPGEIIRIGSGRRREVMARAPAPPLCFDFLPDGTLLVVEGRAQRLSRRLTGGGLEPYADLSGLAEGLWNEIVIDRRGNAYVNSGGGLALATPDGKARRVAEGGAFPNGMAVTPDNRTLIMAESMGRCLTAFDIAADGTLSNRRLWAALDGYPDGICLDREGCVWYADVPNRRCVRVREGGLELQSVALDLGAFSCTLGGPEGHTLFITTARWLGMDRMAEMPPDGQVLAVEVEIPGAGWP